MINIRVRNNYIERKTGRKIKEKPNANYRNWWIVKWGSNCTSGVITLGNLCLPKELVGKKIRIKVEVIE